jgi:RNA polymerase sigma-70 factor (ECF subfamily)
LWPWGVRATGRGTGVWPGAGRHSRRSASVSARQDAHLSLPCGFAVTRSIRPSGFLISVTPLAGAQLSPILRVRYNVEAMARSDVQLMLDVKAGDDASFELLLRKYRTPLVNYLGRMMGDSATAEDLAQEVFLRVYRARSEYAPSAKFTTWIFRIATNLALNARRDGRYRQLEVSIQEGSYPEDGETRVLQIPDGRADAEEDLLARDRARLIRQAIGELPEKQRAAVLLHKYEEMDYDQIAKVLGCSESALKSLLFRAYETLRVKLAPLVQGTPGPA